jgi:hypothetical protein
MPLQSRILTKFFEMAQKKVEAMNFGIRKNVLQYDDVLNKQRQIIYAERDKVLDGVDIHAQVLEMMKENIAEKCSIYLDETKPSYEWDLEPLNKALEDKLLEKGTNLVTKELVEDQDINSVSQIVYEKVSEIYENKIAEIKKLGLDFSLVERDILLRVVDKFWTDIEGIAKEIRKAGVEKQVIVKTGDDKPTLDLVKKYAPEFMFVPMVWHKDKVTKKLRDAGVNVIGAEILFDKEEDECISDKYIKKMHKDKLLIWTNSIIYDERAVISAHHTDDISLKDDPEKGWGWLLDKNIDFIQTDWLLMLKQYMASR